MSVVAAVLVAASCVSAPPSVEIARDRAITIARTQVTWQPFDVAATRAVSNGRRIWRVTLKGRLPAQPPMLFETAVVEIDSVSGAIVSVAKV